MASNPWKRYAVGGFFLLFSGSMILVLMVSYSLLLGLLSVVIMYLLTQSTCSLFIGSQFLITSKSTMYGMFYMYQMPVLCSFRYF